MLLSLTAKLLHVVILKKPLSLFMAENNSESVDVDPPFQHSHTWNGYLLTGSCCSRGRVSFCCWTWTLECLKLKRRRVFFLGYAFGYGHKTTGATYGPSVAEVSSALSRRAKKCAQKNRQKKILNFESKIIIPTLYCVRNVNISLHCKFRSGAWRHRADFHDSLVTFED